MRLKRLIVPVLMFTSSIFGEDYVVRQGDTLSGIAAIHGMTLEKLKEINDLNGDRIKAGQKLYVGDYRNHIVKSGENLEMISKKYGISIADLKRINSLKSDRIYAGQKLNIFDFSEHTVSGGESLIAIAGRYNMTLEELKTLNDMDTDVIRTGQVLKVGQARIHTVRNGENLGLIARKYSTTTSEIMKVNNLENSRIYPGQELKVTGSNTTPRIAARPSTGNLDFYWPIQWRGVNSSWGYRTHPVSGKRGSFHSGVDLKAPMNTPVKAAEGGTVRIAGWLSGYGKTVIVDHTNGYSTLYAHLDKIDVRAGQRIEKGSKIAESGRTGNVTGPHLHFEVRLEEKSVDPMKFRG